MRRYTSIVSPNRGPNGFGYIISDEDDDVVEVAADFPTMEAAQAAATKKVAELKMADRFD